MAGQGCGSFPGSHEESDVAAKIGTKTITIHELDESIKTQLAKIESERYEARKAKLDQMIEDALLADKAKSLGIPKDDLVKREITDKAKLPTDEDVKAAFDKLKGRTGDATLETLGPHIKDMLATQAINTRQADYIRELKQEAKITINISPPRFDIDTSTGHAEGPVNAPITFVEFSDYQCPFCGRSQDAVKKVLEKYDGKIHHVFMDFPLTSIHPFAMQAAVASHCADEQGKYEAVSYAPLRASARVLRRQLHEMGERPEARSGEVRRLPRLEQVRCDDQEVARRRPEGRHQRHARLLRERHFDPGRTAVRGLPEDDRRRAGAGEVKKPPATRFRLRERHRELFAGSP